MTITAFDKPAVKALRDEINEALLALAEKHGISIAAGSATFAVDGSNGTFKLNFAVGAGKDGSDLRLDKFAAKLPAAHALYFPDLKLDATYQILGRGRKLLNVQIVGYNSRAHEYPIIAKVVGADTTYKLSAEHLRRAKVVG